MPMMSEMTASLLSALPMPVVVIGTDGIVAAMNDRATALLGLQGVGRSHMTVIRAPAVLDCVTLAQRGGQPEYARYIHQNPTHEAIYRVIAAPIKGESGRGVCVSFEDITDLESADQMRRDFVANVSHELKTPLTALLGFIETLRGAAREDADARDRFLTIMERETERMNRLVSDLLSLNRVQSSERQRPQDSIAIADVVHSTLLALRPSAEAAEVTLEVETQPDVDLTVQGDADQLQQVLSNLAENAIKYGGSGGRVRIGLSRIERELAFRGPAVQIEVRDYGDGFDPIHIPRITERFYRVDTHRSRAQGGTGLGLAIAKHIVNRHRGRLRIDSAPGKGSQFTVLLPAT